MPAAAVSKDVMNDETASEACVVFAQLLISALLQLAALALAIDHAQNSMTSTIETEFWSIEYTYVSSMYLLNAFVGQACGAYYFVRMCSGCGTGRCQWSRQDSTEYWFRELYLWSRSVGVLLDVNMVLQIFPELFQQVHIINLYPQPQLFSLLSVCIVRIVFTLGLWHATTPLHARIGKSQ